MDDLFTTTTTTAPLYERMRPTSLKEVVGQTHLLGVDKPLTLAFEAKSAHSMILWGPPGVGKTTIAKLTAKYFNCELIALSATDSGVKDIRNAVDLAYRYQARNKQTILFIDEIHRFNKSQQDALLPHVESGLFILIGATTENPSFEVNSALLSRTCVYVLKPLNKDDFKKLLTKIKTEIYPELKFTNETVNLISEYADGDARKFIGLVENCAVMAKSKKLATITKELTLNVMGESLKRFDKNGDNFYDQISALHKSVRGSNPDAALYWLCRMLDAGADPIYLSRRIMRMAWEDIGLADPRALQIATDAAATYERLGSPEGELALAQAVVYLAVTAKSNAGYVAFNKAKAFVAAEKQSRDVPLHLKNAPTDLMKKLKYGQSYRYAHNEPNAYAAGATYLPEGLSELNWYQPTDRGLEIQIKEKMDQLKEWDLDYIDKNKK